MTDRGRDKAAAIRGELRCPQCDYSLRGLAGNIVTCPECGLLCDIARMVTSRWIGPWWEAPGYTRLVRPVAWAVFAAAGCFVASGSIVQSRFDTTVVISMIGVLLAIPIIWMALMWHAHRLFPDGRGLPLALLAHALFAGYLAATIGIAAGLIQLVWGFNPGRLIVAIVILPLMIALFWLCRRGERYIAEQCIRKYVAEQSAPASRGSARRRQAARSIAADATEKSGPNSSGGSTIPP